MYVMARIVCTELKDALLKMQTHHQGQGLPQCSQQRLTERTCQEIPEAKSEIQNIHNHPYQTIPTKPSLPNHPYQTIPTITIPT